MRLHVVLFVLVQLLLSVHVDCRQKLINIDYLGIGYDAIQGNPQSDLEDPGFKQSVFPLEYTDQTVTADGRFLLPDNTEAYQMMNCGYQASSQEVGDERSYRHSLSVCITAATLLICQLIIPSVRCHQSASHQIGLNCAVFNVPSNTV